MVFASNKTQNKNDKARGVGIACRGCTNEMETTHQINKVAAQRKGGNPNPISSQNRNHEGLIFPLLRMKSKPAPTNISVAAIPAGQGHRRPPLKVSPATTHLFLPYSPMR